MRRSLLALLLALAPPALAGDFLQNPARTIPGPKTRGRDLPGIPDSQKILYSDWNSVRDALHDVKNAMVAAPQTWAATGNGVATVYTIAGADITAAAAYYVSVGGVQQTPTTDYTVDANADTLTFTTAPGDGLAIFIHSYGFGTVGSVADSSNVTATGASTSRALADRFADVVNVKDYGAVCNGVANDSTAVAAALAAIGSARRVLEVPGTCLVTTTTTIPANVTVRYLGAGFTGGGIRAAGGTPSSALVQPTDVYFHHLIQPVQPSMQDPAAFPMGNDLLLQTNGPADLTLTAAALDLTSSTSVAAPGVVTITVSGPTGAAYVTDAATCKPSTPTACLAPPSSAVMLLVEPGGANQEWIAAANWSIASATTITATFANTHTQPFTVRQVGGIFLNANDFRFTHTTTRSYLRGVDSTLAIPYWTITPQGGYGNLYLGNSSNSSLRLEGAAGAGSISGGGTASNLILYPAQGGTGTCGSVQVLNNRSDAALAFGVNTCSREVQLAPVAFASLGAPGNGTLAYCSDCTKATPCAGGGTGALAKRLNGAWDCN